MKISSIFMALMYSSCIFAQNSDVFIKDAWNDIKKNSFSDSVQNVYGNKLYNFYLGHREEALGKEALQNAFAMWGNIGNGAMVENAITQIDINSDVWQNIIVHIGNAYIRNNYKTKEELIEYYGNLSSILVEPLGRSEVLFALCRHYQMIGDNQSLIHEARRIVELNASEFYVQIALGYLYETESLSIGQKAPNFVKESYDGTIISLSDYNDNIVILDFWATWCGPCIPEVLNLKRLESKFSRNKVSIIGIALQDKSEELEKFLIENDIHWPQIIESEIWDGEITSLYNVVGIPSLYILKNGIIVDKNLKGDLLEKKINSLIENRQNK